MSFTEWVTKRINELKPAKSAAGLGRALGADPGNRNTGKMIRQGVRPIQVSEIETAAAYLEVSPIELLLQLGLDLRAHTPLTVEDAAAAARAIKAQCDKREDDLAPEMFARYMTTVLEEWLVGRREGSSESMDAVAERVFRINDNLAA